nr:PIG-L family deacetylase [Amycolatopsis pithecellobii]
MLVVSAHAGDFVWRGAGVIALATARGGRATVLCLTFGERGESAKAWRAGNSPAEIKQLRRKTLGADIRFLDAGDYPLVESPELVDRIVHVYREVVPTSVFDTKRKAMECLPVQQHMWDYYTDLAKRRGVQIPTACSGNCSPPRCDIVGCAAWSPRPGCVMSPNCTR